MTSRAPLRPVARLGHRAGPSVQIAEEGRRLGRGVRAATGTLTLGLALNGIATRPYQQTRDATAGPDVVVKPRDPSPAALAALAPLATVIGVVAGRVIGQRRRVGLLKAVGAGPAMIAAVHLAEYLTIGLAGAGAGLAAGWLTAAHQRTPATPRPARHDEHPDHHDRARRRARGRGAGPHADQPRRLDAPRPPQRANGPGQSTPTQ
jgi:hypothetical protein